jgi:DNA-binding LacI/PurR family transcriptional regulator
VTPHDATLKDVARHAGVSITTVSRVLHNNGYASPQVRRRVETALRESGYRLNAVAQDLRRRRTITLGIIIHGSLSNPFYAEIAMGAEEAAAEQGFDVLLSNAHGDPQRERESVERLLTRRVDGIVFSTALRSDNVRLALDAGVSAVEVERSLCDDAPSILVDNYAGSNEAMRHLLDLGHRRIGYVGEPWLTRRNDDGARADSVIRQRFESYRSSLGAAGVAFDQTTIVAGPYPREQGGWGGIETGAAYMAQLLDQAADITAVFAVSDILAAGALQALHERRIRVPDQISIVGFDDTFAHYLSPALTTVVQPMFEMGFKAASLAINLVGKARSTKPLVQYCPTKLVVRKSTAPPQPAPERSSGSSGKGPSRRG